MDSCFLRKAMAWTCAVSVAGMLASGSAMATLCSEYDVSVLNPANLPLTQTREGVQDVVSMLLKNQKAHAAAEAENSLFRSPSVFAEYLFSQSHEDRPGGFLSRGNNGVVGLNFMTAGDVAMGLMSTYGGSHGETAKDVANNQDNFGLTLSAAKSCDWLIAGASASYNYSYSRTRAGGPVKVYSDGFTLAPFVGAVYVKGNLSLSTVPTYMMNWNWQDYDSTGPSSADDHASTDTFVWMNTVSYAFTEKLSGSLVMNWNRVMNVKQNLVMPARPSDREWLTVGPKVSYAFTPALTGYVSFTKDLCNATYSSLQAVAGVSYGF